MASIDYLAHERSLALERIETAAEILNGPMALDLPAFPSELEPQARNGSELRELDRLRWFAEVLSLIAARGTLPPGSLHTITS